ncbi:type II secretion system protein [Candidatus Saccharibacteria bacterium]|nr:MAG: type II secretion system protein [Candidatus Saccharibacteria bacterium]
MKRGGKNISTHGFTVVETLIVLAVTSGLFVITAVAINGRQQKTEFQVGIRNLQQQFQQIITEAATGYYPVSSSFRCSLIGGGDNVRLQGGGSNEQGSNEACTFVGKALVVGGPDHLDNYSVFSLAARRVLDDGVTEVRNPAEAMVTAIAPSSANGSSPDTQITKPIPNALTFVSARPVGLGWASGEVAASFLSGFANFEGSGEETGGSQRLELRGFANWSTGVSDADAIDREAIPGPGRYPLFPNGVEYCFRSNGTNQSAIVTISSGLAVSYKIKAGITCT